MSITATYSRKETGGILPLLAAAGAASTAALLLMLWRENKRANKNANKVRGPPCTRVPLRCRFAVSSCCTRVGAVHSSGVQAGTACSCATSDTAACLASHLALHPPRAAPNARAHPTRGGTFHDPPPLGIRVRPYPPSPHGRTRSQMISGRSSVRFDQARKRLLACGYEVSDCELTEIHCNQVGPCRCSSLPVTSLLNVPSAVGHLRGTITEPSLHPPFSPAFTSRSTHPVSNLAAKIWSGSRTDSSRASCRSMDGAR